MQTERAIETKGTRSVAGESSLPTLALASNPLAPRLLVVEDDRAVQRALKRLFEGEGFAVEICADGKSAVEAFRAAAPSAIVLDLRLPAMPGRDVCREIKQQAPSVPIIVLSATSDGSDKVLLLELGADDYVTKRISPVMRGHRMRMVRTEVLPPVCGSPNWDWKSLGRESLAQKPREISKWILLVVYPTHSTAQI